MPSSSPPESISHLNFSCSLSVLADVEIAYAFPDSDLFPNTPDNVMIHGGWAADHQRTAQHILEEVKRLMAEKSSSNVVVVGLYSPTQRDSVLNVFSDTRSATHWVQLLRNSTRSSSSLTSLRARRSAAPRWRPLALATSPGLSTSTLKSLSLQG